eukprot:scaffold27199_cov61-Cyclotella_meneghiniana.AAC.2
MWQTTELFTLHTHTHSKSSLWPPLLTLNQSVDTLSGKAFQSRPHNIIQYIHNETLGQSSSNGLDVKVCPVTDSALFRWGNQLHSSPSIHSKSSPWTPLLAKHSNPDHITSFNISTMRHWESPSAMLWQTTELFTLPALKIQSMDKLSGKEFQSRPHNIIQYIHNETLGQSSSNGLDLKVLPVTDSALFSWGNQIHSLSSIHSKSILWPPLLAKHSNPDHITSFNIHNETLGQSSSNGLDLKNRPVTDSA